MSKEGIELAAKVFTMMQQTRYELLRMGTKPNTKPNFQDIKLGQMLEDGKNAMVKQFEKLTLEKDE